MPKCKIVYPFDSIRFIYRVYSPGKCGSIHSRCLVLHYIFITIEELELPTLLRKGVYVLQSFTSKTCVLYSVNPFSFRNLGFFHALYIIYLPTVASCVNIPHACTHQNDYFFACCRARTLRGTNIFARRSCWCACYAFVPLLSLLIFRLPLHRGVHAHGLV